MIRSAALRTVLGGVLLAALGLGTAPVPGTAQESDENVVHDPALFEGLEYRMVGPFRGGRSTAVTGHPTKLDTWFMGTTGGGVWETQDLGQSWHNVSDGQLHVGSIGAVDVANSDPNVIYVGTGSACIRGNVSTGRGVYKSTDGGEEWEFVGLEDAGQIGDLWIHPQDPDRVYLAALGHPFGHNSTRGVYRSEDGGENWEQILFVSDSTGFVDLAMDPNNPRILYAAAWQAERDPWVVRSGGTEGGIWKTKDGGDTWTKLGGGLPTGTVGKAAVEVSPADPDRVWVLMEAPEPDAGLYRSDDGGRSFRRINDNRQLLQRAYYYIHLTADPQDPNTLYALNTGLYRSVDGGESFEFIPVPHGDVHDLWVHPEDPERMVVANDGGGQVSINGGDDWSTYYNQPTAEFYSVEVDNEFPYRLYGPQQDNSTITVPSWNGGGISPKQFWHSIGGCETGPISFDRDDPTLIYSGCYGGVIDRWDAETKQVRNMMVYPQLQLGTPAEELKYRFQWVSPILVSQHDPSTVYHASNMVHRTRDRGMTWEEISPDLTADRSDHQQCGGVPITCEGTGVEVFNTIFVLTESPHREGELWAGTDDGHVWIRRGGTSGWTEITPAEMPELATVNRIDLSEHAPGTAYMAVHRYRLDDWRPYIFKTADYGDTWELLTTGENGIPADHPTRVVRADPEREGLLYAGTEFGLFVSFDDGAHWQSLKQNLPTTPVTDLAVHRGDLVVATQGRSFWIMDEIAPLRQLDQQVASADRHLFAPDPAFRVNQGFSRGGDWPEAPPSGAILFYYLAEDQEEELTLEISDSSGEVVRSFSSEDAGGGPAGPFAAFFGGGGGASLSTEAGMHRFTWNLQTEGVETTDDATLWGYTGGVKVVPGSYTVRLSSGDWSQERELEVRKDPRLEHVTRQDLVAQWETANAVKDSLQSVFDHIEELRAVREQVENVVQQVARKEGENGGGDVEEVRARADSIAEALTSIESELINTKSEARQDPINYQPKLDNQYAYLYGIVAQPDGRPNEGVAERFTDLNAEWSELLRALQDVLRTDVEAFNRMLLQREVAPIISDAAAGRP